MRIPRGLSWWREEEGGADWLASLPTLVTECVEQWSLRPEEPLEPAHISLVVPVRLPDGRSAVLKVNFPDEESEHEPRALRDWGGRGAVLLLADDEERRALVVERCIPGTPLWSIADDEEATRLAAAVLRRLWVPAREAEYRRLSEVAARWSSELARDWDTLGRPFERMLLDAAVEACRDLGESQDEEVLLHQDFHGGNVLQAEREPWLAIDPKPLLGERAFDAASLLRDRRWELGAPDDRRRLRRRLDILEDELELDRERMVGWGVAHALAWGMDEREVEEDMIHCARLHLDAGS